MMSLDKLKPEAQRTLAAAVPAAVLLFAGFLIVPKAMEYSAVSRQAGAYQKETELRKRQNLTELAAEGRQQLSAAAQTRDEPLAFLKELNRMVAASRVRLVSYRPPAAAGSGARPAGPAAGSDSPVKPMGCDVTVSGSFVKLVTLFQTLARNNRLYTVGNLQVRTDAYPRLSATFRLVRYVTPVSVAVAQTRGAEIMRTASAATGERSPSLQ